jgi:hypothetical protein
MKHIYFSTGFAFLNSFTKSIILFAFTVFALNATAQVDVTATGGTNASYTTLKAAFDAINAGSHTGTIALGISANTTETAPAVLNASGTGSASYTSVSIQPTGGAARTISGAIVAGSPLIDLNGADNVTIDGLNTGGNSLTISNTTAAATTLTSTIRFQTDATSNTITRCSILGSFSGSATTNGGNIYFAAGAVTSGNDNNTISNCDIGAAGANLPTKGIYGNGTTTSTTTYNSGITITNNNFINCFGAAVTSASIFVSSGCTDWTITNNRIYQSATRTQTTGAVHAGIQLASSNINNCTITGNTIGYSSNAATGTYTLAGLASTRFYPIYLSSHGVVATTTIQNNTITNISLSGALAGTTTSSPFTAIFVVNGWANISNNTVGSTTNGSISYTSTGTGSADLNGIYHNGAGNCIVSSNSVYGITVTNSSTGTTSFWALRVNTASTATSQITNNIIGNVNGGISLTSSTATSRIIGLQNDLAIPTITGNTINYLSSNAPNVGTGTTSGVLGLYNSATATGGFDISQNTIHSLSSTTASAATQVNGIVYSGASVGTNNISRNLIHTLSASSTAATINGIYINNGTSDFQNNIVRLGTGLTTAASINGINEVAGTSNIYHNTIYIGGSGVGTTASNTFAFRSAVVTNVHSVLNNIFINTRSNSSTGGKHYAVTVAGTTTNPAGLTLNYNIYRATGTGGVFGLYNTADVADLAAWQTAVGMDANSSSANPCLANPDGTISTLDLHLTDCSTLGSPADGSGINVATVTTDFDGQTRSSLSPVDIGADAGNYGPSGSDVGVSAVVNPTAISCHSASENVIVTLNNYSTTSIDFSTTNVTVNSNVTGQVTANLSVTISSGTLAAGASMPVTVGQINTTANGTYTFNSNAVIAGDVNTSNDANVTNVLINYSALSAVISTDADTLCISGTANLTAAGAGGTTPYSYSWSTGATTSVISVSPTSTTVYTLTVTDGCGITTSANRTTTVLTPSVTGTTDGSRCGTGTVNLSATGSAGTSLRWYANSTGGTALGTGSSFTTPSISSTTTFYVAANSGAYTGTITGARTAPTSTSATTASTYGLVFNAVNNFTIKTVDVYPTSAGNVVMVLQNSAGTQLLTTTVAVPALSGTVPHSITLNFPVAIGTGYRLLAISSPNMVRETSLGGFPYSLGQNGSITNGYNSGTTTAYYYFYNWKMTGVDSCESGRTAVIATVNSNPTVSITGTPNFCPSSFTTLTANASAGTGTITSYQWSLNGTAISLATNSTYDANAVGSYTVDVSNSAGCSGTSSPQAVTITQYPVTLSVSGNGTITPNVTSLDCESSQIYTITPAGCSHIDSLVVDGINQGAISSYALNSVTAAHTIHAYFSVDVFTISATASAGGTITPSGSVNVNCGTDQSFAIAADPCYQIDSVVVDGVNLGALSSHSFTNTTANHTIAAYFSIITYSVVASSGPNGIVTPSGTSVVNCGSNITYTITPDPAYTVNDVLVDGNSVGAVTSYTFTAVGTNHTISATFFTCTSPAIADAGADASICPGSNHSLAGSIGGAATSATWSSNGTGSFSPSNDFSTAVSYIPSPADISAGSVILTLTSNDPDGAGSCPADVNSMTLSFFIPPSVAITGQLEICPSGSTTLTANANGGSGTVTAYQWSLNGTTALGTTSTQIASSTGNYSVAVTSSDGCTGSTSVTVTQADTPSVTISGSSPICVGTSTTLTANATIGSGTVSSYLWSLNGTSTGVTTSTISASTQGSYTVAAISNLGCSGTSAPFILSNGTGPLAGLYTVNTAQPVSCTNFHSISSAVTALNINGVAGNVTIDVSAGHTETAPSSGIVLNMCALSNSLQSSSTQTIIFQKAGAGANPLITAGAGTGTTDVIFAIAGADYITIDGISLQESGSNSTATTRAEFGYVITGCSGTDGAQNNTIKNCVITLLKTNTNATTGIAILNNGITVTAVSGTNSYNKLYSNTISNVYHGVRALAFNDLTPPYSFYDQNNEIGATGMGNTITNFGNGGSSLVTSSRGVYATGNNNLNVIENNINSGTGHMSDIRGIGVDAAKWANINILNNTITISTVTTGGNTCRGITNFAGSRASRTDGIVNTININGNIIQNCSYPSTGTGDFIGIYTAEGFSDSLSAHTLNINNNIIRNNTVAVNSTSGQACLMILTQSPSEFANINGNTITGNNYTGTNTASNRAIVTGYGANGTTNWVQVTNINNNIIRNNNSSTTSATGGAISCIDIEPYGTNGGSSPGTQLIATGNNLGGISQTITASGEFHGIHSGGAVGIANVSVNISNNVLDSVSRPNMTGAFFGFRNSSTTAPSATLSGNSISTIVTRGTTTNAFSGVMSTGTTSTTVTMSSNTISNVNVLAAGGVFNGVTTEVATGPTIMNNNTITACTFNGVTTGALNCIRALGATTPSISMSGNTISNISRPTATTSAFSGITSASTSATSVDMSNNAVFNVTTTAATSGTFTVMTQAGSTTNTLALTMENNNFHHITHSGTGTFIGFDAGDAKNYHLNNNLIQNNTKNAGATGIMTLFTLAGSTTLTDSLIATNNILSNNSLLLGTSTMIVFDYGSAKAHIVSGNQVLNNNKTSATTGTLTCFTGAGSSTSNTSAIIENNTISGNTSTSTTSTTTLMLTPASINLTIRNNTISNNSKNGSNGTYTCMSVASSGSVNVYGNSILNNGITNSSGSTATTVTGILVNSISATENIHENTVSNLFITGANSAVHPIVGIRGGTGTPGSRLIWGNTVSNLNSGTITSTVSGISGGTSGGTVDIFKNKIFDLFPGGAAGTAKGISVTNGTTISVYNNLIGLNYSSATPATGANAINGIDVIGGTTVNLWYNTIRLNGSGTGTTFGSSGINISTTPTTELKNNLVINNMTPGSAGLTVAHRRSSTTATTFASGSNNNLWYAGTPGSTRLIYSDGTNSDQTLAAYKTRFDPIENAAVTENVLFISTTGSNAFFLHVDTTVATLVESGAINISGISDDYDGNARSATPDIGADEGNFQSTALALTNVSAAPSTGQCVATSHTVTATVTPSATPISYVRLFWSYNGGPLDSVAMTLVSGNNYSGVIPAATPSNATVTWFVRAADATFIKIVNGTSYRDEYVSAYSMSTSTSQTSICPGETVNLTGIVGAAGTTTVGTFIGTYNTTGNPLRAGAAVNAVVKTQLLVRASELVTAGLAPGNITSLAFIVNSTGGTMGNFSLSIGHTTASEFTTTSYLTPTMTTVYTNAGPFTPAVGTNPYNFSTPFNWDGTSNILVEVCLTNITTGTSVVQVGNPGFTANLHVGSTSTTCATATGAAFPNRPLMVFGGIVGPSGFTYAWVGSPAGHGLNSTTGSNVTATPSATGVYNYTVTATDGNGCTLSGTVSVTANPTPNAPTGFDNNQCGIGVPTAYVANEGNLYRWYLVPTGGTPLANENDTVLINYSISSTTTFYVSQFDGSCESPRTAVTQTVILPDAVTASALPNSTCPGTAVSLSAAQTGSNNVYNFEWTASPSTGSGVSGSVSGQNVSVTPTAGGTFTYTVTATDISAQCVTVSTVTVSVTPPPVITSVTSTYNTICAGTPDTLKAFTGSSAAYNQVLVGPAPTTTTQTGMPIRSGNGTAIKNQYLFTASELTAAGLSAGTITSLTYNYTTGAGAGGSCPNTTIKIGHTNVTALTTTFQAEPANLVFGPVSVVPPSTVGLFTMNFSTPFTWDGTSNILIQFCHDLPVSSGSGFVEAAPTTTNCVTYTGAACTTTTGTTQIGARPVFRFSGVTGSNGTGNSNWQWAGPGPVLPPGNIAVVSPTTTGANIYTVTATDPATNCTATASITINVIEAPPAPVATDSIQCGVGVPLVFVTGSGGLFRWYLSPTGGTAIPNEDGPSLMNYTISTTTTFYVSEFDGSCESVRTAVVATVNQSDAVTATITQAAACPGTSLTLNAVQTGSTNTYNYVWTVSPDVEESGIIGSANGASVVIVPTDAGTYVYTVTATDAAAQCVVQSTVSLTVTNPPAIQSVSASSTNICEGTPVTLIAATSGQNTGSVTLGTGTAQFTGATSPYYRNSYEGYKTQFLVRATALQALGLQAGNLSALSFIVTAAPGTPTLNYNKDWTLSLANTTATEVGTAWVTSGLQVVYGPVDYSPVVGVNTHTFNTPFYWDGVSNIVVQACRDNDPNNTCASCFGNNPTMQYNAGVGYVATRYFGAVNTTQSNRNVCDTLTNTGSQSNLPHMIFTPQVSGSADSLVWSWNPGSLSNDTVTVSPLVTTTYTVTALDTTTGCSTSQTITVNVEPVPVAPVTTPSSQCGPGVPAASVTGSGGLFNWYLSNGSGLLFSESFETFPFTQFAVSNDSTNVISVTQNSTYYQQGSKSAKITHTDYNRSNFTMVPSVNLTGTLAPRLSFYHIAALEDATTVFDVGTVQYSTDGGSSWNAFPQSAYMGTGTLVVSSLPEGYQVPAINFSTKSYPDWITTFTATTSTPGTGPATALWKHEVVDLSAYNTSTNFKVRFRMHSDPNTIYYGWLIDNVTISDGDVTPIQSSGDPSLTSYSISNTTTFYVAEFNGVCEGPRSSVIATVTPGDSISISATDISFCLGDSTKLVAHKTGTVNNYTYNWSASPQAGSGLTGSVQADSLYITPTAAGTYVYTLTAVDAVAQCNSVASITVSVGAAPSLVTTTATPPVLCQGNQTTLSAIVGAPGSATVGTQSATIGGNDGNPYRSGNGNNNQVRSQMLFRASELISQGFSAGSITGIGFTVTTITGSSTTNNFEIKMGHTTDNVLTTTFLTSPMTTVFTAASWTPVVGVNTHTFSTPFVWDGVSNIVINVCQLNLTGGGTTTIAVYTTGFNANLHKATSTTACTDLTGAIIANRPVVTFSGIVGSSNVSGITWTWNPGNLSGSSVQVTPPSGTTVYTATASTSQGCSTSNTVSVTTLSTPPTPIITSSVDSICQSGTATLTYTNPMADAVVQWQQSTDSVNWVDIAGATGTTYVTPTLTSSIYYRVTATCISQSNSFAKRIVVSTPTLTSTTGASRCGGGPVTISANGTGTIKWYTAATAGTLLFTGNPYQPLVSANSTFWAESSVGTCVNTGGRIATSVTVTAAPTISVVTSPSTTICAGTTVTLTGSSTNDPNYTYYWSTDGVNPVDTGSVFTASPSSTITYYTYAVDSSGGSFHGCGAIASTAITVNQLPDVPIVSPSSAVICNVGDSVTLTVTNPSSGSSVQSVGPLSPAIGTFATWTSTAQWHNFSVLAPSVQINTVDMFFSGSVGSAFTVVIRDASSLANVFTYSGTISVSSSTVPQVVPLNATLPAGNYQMNMGTNPGVYRNSTGAVYPYTIPGILSITGNTFSTVYYYIFYNWQVQVGTPSTYTWAPGGATGTSITVTPTSTTTYSVTASNSSGCSATSAPVTVTYSPATPPTITASGPTTICEGDSITLDAGSGYTSYSWSDGSSTISTSQVVTVTPGATTTYTVTGVNGNCLSNSSIQINVNAVIPATVSSSLGLSFCEPNSTTLSVSAPFSTYSWSTTETTSTISVNASGTYSVHLVDANGCGQDQSITIVRNAAPPTPTATATGSTDLCWDGTNGVSTSLHADTTGAGAGAAIQWNDFFSSDGADIFPTTDFDLAILGNPWTFSFMVTNAAGCASTSNGIVVTAGLIPQINSFSPSSGCTGDVITIDGLNFTSAVSVSFNGTAATSYTVVDDTTITVTVPAGFTTGPILVTSLLASCTGTSTGNFTNTCVTTTTLNVKMFIQGYYTGGGFMEPALFNEGVVTAGGTDVDSVTISLMAATSPYGLIAQFTGVVQTNGMIQCTFAPAIAGSSYYIRVSNPRNLLTTWSAGPVSLSSLTTYDFTDDNLKAYQDIFSTSTQQVLVEPGVWAMYNGDVNQDETIDGFDFAAVEVDVNDFAFGYYLTDISNAGPVDGFDFAILEQNAALFLFVARP